MPAAAIAAQHFIAELPATGAALAVTDPKEDPKQVGCELRESPGRTSLAFRSGILSFRPFRHDHGTKVTIQELGSIGEFVAALATVATLVYLAIQIRSNTNAVRSAAAQSVHEAFSTWYRMLASDASLSQLVADGLRDYSRLSETDKARFIATFMAFLSCSQDAYIKWREGSLSAALWEGWELVMMNLVNAPGGKDFWEERGYLFGDEFRRHVESDIMQRKPHPRAKPMGAFSIGDFK